MTYGRSLRSRPSQGARLIAFAALLLLLPGLGGCAKNYIVTSRLVENSRTEKGAEVTRARSYDSVLKRAQTVALRAPDSCANEGAATARGESASRAGILQTNCGVEMSELERALARSGFGVVSWDAVRKMVSHEDVTPVEASRRLGADILFMINSLERTLTDPGINARWEREFFAANARGESQGRTAVPESRAQSLESLMAGPEKALLPGARQSATINVSAVDVSTGRSIWFYEWTHTEPYDKDIETQALFQCKSSYCQHTDPDMRSLTKKILDSTPIVGDVANMGIAIAGNFYNTEAVRGGSMDAVTTGRDAANQEMHVYHQLVRHVVTDLVTEFSTGAAYPASRR
ncbi:MAG: hypothetical protein QNK04_09755 [Myxococcota bacterium]|nr:hypothetical protein [Myxococcota bacterium]